MTRRAPDFRDRAALGLLVLAAVVLLLATLELRLIPNDTDEYLRHNPVRPALFPLFLDLCRLLFGSHFLRGAVILQSLFGAASAWIAARVLASRFGIGRAGEAVVLGLLLWPQLQHAAVIGSESLAYDLYLLTAAGIVESLHDPSARRLGATAACAALAVEARAQMLFLVPLLGAGLLVLFWSGARRRALAFAGVGVALWLALGLFNRTYNYVFSHKFATVPIAGIQALTANLYVATPDDEGLFRGDANEPLVAEMFRRVEAGHLALRYKPFGVPTRLHYYDSYAKICFDVIMGVWLAERAGRPFDRVAQFNSYTPDELIALDAETLSIARKLFHRTWRRWAVNVVKCWWQDAGLLGVLALLVWPASLLGWRHSRDPRWGVLAFTIGLWAANNLLVCMLNIINPRYTFYTDATLMAVALAAVLSLIQRGLTETSSVPSTRTPSI